MEEWLKKLHIFSSLLFKRPSNFWDRMVTSVEARLDNLRNSPYAYASVPWQEAMHGLQQCLDVEIVEFLKDPYLTEIENDVRVSIDRMGSSMPIPVVHNIDFKVAHLYYALCRATKPAIVVETGVASGVSSAFILKALAANGSGTLHSIDLPLLEPKAERFVGAAIPQHLKRAWHLHRGRSKRLLHPLLQKVKGVDIFIHDSLHTYRNMRREFDTVLPFLHSNSVIIADDIERNRAFYDYVRTVQPIFWAAMAQNKDISLVGICVIGSRRLSLP
jgi:hypothetical protein